MRDLSILETFYNANKDFQGYVDRIMQQRHMSKIDVLSLKVVHAYYDYIIEKGEKSDDRTEEFNSTL